MERHKRLRVHYMTTDDGTAANDQCNSPPTTDHSEPSTPLSNFSTSNGRNDGTMGSRSITEAAAITPGSHEE
ncbi:MAG: hypothetical protein KDA93_19050 [Planctomycetaceae bacterium]|nr:hypothetical protein [Planctomycetaceae bacterium]